ASKYIPKTYSINKATIPVAISNDLPISPPVEFSEFLAQYDIIRVTTKKYRKYFLSHPLELGQFGLFY
ncbi:hypothetical protein, partial [Lactococcus lactis]|uniref:hypothetical protein n=1 Tax=Lactococcus lactis TaxID=1358 RepID=UPI001BAC2AA5